MPLATWTGVTRGVPRGVPRIGSRSAPLRPTDLALTRVVRVGALDHVEDRDGRIRPLRTGDLLVGARAGSACDPGERPDVRALELVSADGLLEVARGAVPRRPDATLVSAEGTLVSPDGLPLSTLDFARRPSPHTLPSIGTVVVVGTGPDARPSETTRAMAAAFARDGFVVGVGRVSGRWSAAERADLLAAGATHLADFLDHGLADGSDLPAAVGIWLLGGLRDQLAHAGSEIVVLEVAERAVDAGHDALWRAIGRDADAAVLAADGVGTALVAIGRLRRGGAPLRAATGPVAGTPPDTRAIAAATGLPVLTSEAIAAGAAVIALPEIRCLVPRRSAVGAR